MFGTSATPGKEATATEEARSSTEMQSSTHFASPTDANSGGEKRTSRAGSPSGTKNGEEVTSGVEKKRRSSGVAKARDILSSAKQSLHLHSSSASSASGASEKAGQSPIQRLGKADPALSVPQGSLNNSAGESAPGPKSTFRVGVTEDKNKKCRRTMEDTHAYLYNFLSTPAPALGSDLGSKHRTPPSESSSVRSDAPPVLETDNGYFAIFDGHAGTFAADWCGKKLHVILEENIRRNPNTPIPELLDLTFTSVDQQLEKLPVKNSGCTAVIAVLRWEDRVPNSQSATGSSSIAPATAAAIRANADSTSNQAVPRETTSSGTGQAEVKGRESRQHDGRPDHGEAPAEVRLRESATRQRVLYTANVGDARIVLCRNGRALRLSYDHKGSDENEGKRVANAGGLILNNRVNGVLAVTRALGDAYMKDLVTGHPYTTETVIQPDQDEFLILACDGLWDVCSDQEAVDLVRHTSDPQAASKQLVDHALTRFSTDNLSCMIVRFDNKALKQRKTESTIGVDGDPESVRGGISEADAIVSEAKKRISVAGEEPGKGNAEMIVEEQEPGPEMDVEPLKSGSR